MSYIINNTNAFVSIKLTEIGRQLLAMGQLSFSYWGIGDSELNYEREAIVDANPTDVSLSGSSKILRPVDRQPNIKYYITPTGVASPLQNINSSNLNVVKAVVNNSALERGFFDNSGFGYTTATGSTYTPFKTSINNAKLTGGTTLDLATSTSAITVGDILLLKVSNTASGNVSLTETTRALPNLWYKIQALTTSGVTLDRITPNYSSQVTTSQVIVYRGGEVYNTIGTGNTTAYWDSGTLSFNASVDVTCSDVPVWNMNNVWGENPAGITGLTTTNLYEDYTKFGSFQYLGTKDPYLEYLLTSSATTATSSCDGPGISYSDNAVKSISIIHYTNNTISNLYGEFFYIDTTNGKRVEIYLPELMYHRRDYSTGSGSTMGMKFVADSGATKYVGSSDIQYVDLMEDSTLISSGNTAIAVGRVYPQLKTIVIYDDEIVAALSYKSNRNWTLPALSANLVAPTGGTSTGVLDVNETVYLTYVLENEGTTSGLTTSLSCQNYIKLTNNSSSAKDIAFRINETDSLPYMRKIESAGYDGLGFHAHKFKLVYQTVSDASIRPDSGQWKVYDYTTDALTTVAGQTINPVALENQDSTATGFVLDVLKEVASTTFDITQSLNLAPNVSPEKLQFGDERFFYGNLTTYIGATIFKTIFDIRIDSSLYNLTSNPTRSKDLSTNPPKIKVSEVGIYDTNKNLVCIGKLSIPVALVPGNTIMLELSMDF